MAAPGNPDRRLRDLHEAYAWEVNAAVAEGREDLIPRLVEAYTAEAMKAMTEEHGTSCGRHGCPACDRPTSPPAKPAWQSWRGRLRRFLAGG